MHRFDNSKLYKKLGASLVAISLIVGSLAYSTLADEIQDLAGVDAPETVWVDENATAADVTTDIVEATNDISVENPESAESTAAVEDANVADNAEQNHSINVDGEGDNEADTEVATSVEDAGMAVDTQATDGKDISFEQSITVDGVVITVTADVGVFPEGAIIKARKVTLSEEKEVSEAIDEIRDEKKNVAVSYTFDITIYDMDGNEIEPNTEKGSVKVTFKMAEIANENLETEVYHVEETSNGLNAEGLDAENVIDETRERSADGGKAPEEANDEVTVETDGFSYYTVEFTYNELQYVLEGAERAGLSIILEAVGIKENGKITEVVGSDDELFKPVFDEEKNAWYIESLKAFSTEEWLKVTIDGIEYEITVTDDGSSTGNGNFEHMIVSGGFNAGVIAPEGATDTQLGNSSIYSGYTGIQSWGQFGGIATQGFLKSKGKTDETAQKYGIPDNGLIIDCNNSNLTWQLAPFDAGVKNALKLNKDNATGTITFSKVGCYQKMWFLTVSYRYGGNTTFTEKTLNETLNISVAINYTDGSQDTKNVSLPHMFCGTDTTKIVYDFVRVRANGKKQDENIDLPHYFTKYSMEVDTSKLISSIDIKFLGNSGNTQDGVVNILALTGETYDLPSPTNLVLSNVMNDKMTATWNAVDSATSYRIDVATDENFNNMVTGFNNKEVTSTSCEITGLNPDTTYYVRVRATVAAGQSPSSTAVSTNTASTHVHDGVSFTAWSNSSALPNDAGSYYLTNDVTLNTTWNVPSSATVNLCLNGHVIKQTSNARVINVPGGSALNLFDCSGAGTKHYFTVGSDGCWSLNDNSTANAKDIDSMTERANTGEVIAVSGGCITGGTTGSGSGIYLNGNSKFVMNGGNIVGNKSTGTSTSGVVLVNPGAEFTMNGGRICGNYTANCGGGVENNGKFTLNGGVISDNYAANNNGSAIQMNNGNAFTLITGGLITRNRVGNNAPNFPGGAVHMYNGTFKMTGGTITGNTAEKEIDGAVTINCTATIGGTAKIIGNTAGGKVNNLYLYSGKTVDIAAGDESPAEGMSIGVTTRTLPTSANSVAVTNGAGSDAYSEYFTSDNTNYNIIKESNVLKLSTKPQYVVYYENGIYNGFAPYWQVGTAPSNGTLIYSDSLTLPGSSDFTNVGYKLAGWTTTKPTNSSATKEYDAGAQLTAEQVNALYNKCDDGKITLYAVWQRDLTQIAWNSNTNEVYTSEKSYTYYGLSNAFTYSNKKGAEYALGAAISLMSADNQTVYVLQDANLYVDATSNGEIEFKKNNSTLDGGIYSAQVSGDTVTRSSSIAPKAEYSGFSSDSKIRKSGADNRFTVNRVGGSGGHAIQTTMSQLTMKNLVFTYNGTASTCNGFFAITPASAGLHSVTLDNVKLSDFVSNSSYPMFLARRGSTDTYTLIDCEITGNQTGDGSVFYVGYFTAENGTTKLILKGNTTINDNKKTGNDFNLVINSAENLTIEDDFTGKVSVYLPSTSSSNMIAAICSSEDRAKGLLANEQICSDQGFRLTAEVYDGNRGAIRVAKSAKLTFSTNGGSGNPPASAKVDGVDTAIENGVLNVYHGAKVVLPGADTFSKTGFAFDCWNTNNAGTGTNYAAGAEYTINADNATLYAKWKHGHSFTFSVDDNVLKAYCIEGCPEGLYTNPLTLTLTAPSNLTYDGTAKAVTFASGENDKWTTAGLEALTITYANKAGEILSEAPKNAGEYVASISKDGKKASLNYEIKKASSSISTPPTAKENLIYNGNAQELITAGQTGDGTIEYSLFEDSGYSTAILKGENVGEYTVYYKVVPDDNHEPYGPLSITVTIAQSDVYDITVPTASYVYGEKLSEKTPTGGTAKAGETVLVGTFSWDDSVKDTVPKVSDSNSTEYDVIFTPSSSGYKAKSCKVKVTVSARDAKDVKADVNFEPGSGTDYTITETLTDIKGNVLHKDTPDPDYEGPIVVKNDNEKTIDYTVTYNLKGNYTGTIEKKFSINKPKQDDPGLHEDDRIVTRVDKENEAVEAFKPELSLDAGNVKKIIAEDMESGTPSVEVKVAAEKLKDNSDEVVCKANVYITVEKEDDSDIDEEQKKRIEEKLKDVKNLDSTAVYLDISMFTNYTIMHTNGQTIVTSPEKKITDTGDVKEVVTIQVPNELRCSDGNIIRTYYVVRDHINATGEAETDILANTTNTIITFSTNKFSTYALRYSDAQKPSGGGDDSDSGKSAPSQTVNDAVVTPAPYYVGFASPKTEDSKEIYVYAAILALGVVLMAVGKRKRTFKSKE